MSASGHEERFPPTTLGAGCGFREETLAGTRRNGRDSPLPDLPAFTPERGGSPMDVPTMRMSDRARPSSCGVQILLAAVMECVPSVVAVGYQYVGCIGLSGLGYLGSFALQLCHAPGFETVGNLADVGYVSY